MIGYARVSTEDQATDAQTDELKAAGCEVIHQEHGSGASRARPVLARLKRDIGKDEVLVVTELNRLARGVPHMWDIMQGLRAKGVAVRIVNLGIDSSTPGMLPKLAAISASASNSRCLKSKLNPRNGPS
jgi:DNA invertase Pin-like site-specific DNA recombinase